MVLATPSMLQAGLSRELFEAWAPDPRNAVIIADFAVQARSRLERNTHTALPWRLRLFASFLQLCLLALRRNLTALCTIGIAQGTLARDILQDAKTAPRRNGNGTVPVNCSVDGISFSAHADYPQTQEFVSLLQPRHVMLVHGEATEMGRLRKALETRAATDGQRLNLYTPRNAQAVHIAHRGEKVAKVIGRLVRCPGSASGAE